MLIKAGKHFAPNGAEYEFMIKKQISIVELCKLAVSNNPQK